MTSSFTNLIGAIASEIKDTRCIEKTSSTRKHYYYWHVASSKFNTNNCTFFQGDCMYVEYTSCLFNIHISNAFVITILGCYT